jgi:hypothetical protein
MKNAFSIIPLTVEARGEIITNNLPEFRELVREALGKINRDLKSDEDFGQAEVDVKALKAAEDAVRDAAVQAFDERLKTMVAELTETAEEIRTPRLELEKLIAKRKDEVKSEIVEAALATFDIDASLARRIYLKGLQDELKGKRTLESMQKAVRFYAATQQALIAECRKLLDSFEKAHGADLIPDRRNLEVERPEYVEAELRRRFEAKKANDEKAKLQAELAAAQAARMNPHNLPAPPKIGSIQVGNVVPANVVPIHPASDLVLTNEDTAAHEWQAMTATVIAAFGLIKEHRQLLTHEANVERIAAFGAGVNALWKEINGRGEA